MKWLNVNRNKYNLINIYLVASEFITRRVLQEIKFYRMFNPFENLKSILFKNGKLIEYSLL